MTRILLIALFVVITTDLTTSAFEKARNIDPCGNLQSCSSCLSKSYCSWCINKSYCTKTSCGNDNVIYSDNAQALMAGIRFCPRIVVPKTAIILKSGQKYGFEVRITQLHIYMAFTKWKCKITINGKEYIVDAAILIDLVKCDLMEINNESDTAYIDGNVAVIWDHKKQFDGAVPFRVCRCDFDRRCVVCKK